MNLHEAIINSMLEHAIYHVKQGWFQHYTFKFKNGARGEVRKSIGRYAEGRSPNDVTHCCLSGALWLASITNDEFYELCRIVEDKLAFKGLPRKSPNGTMPRIVLRKRSLLF